jgi:hypothetical protein
LIFLLQKARWNLFEASRQISTGKSVQDKMQLYTAKGAVSNGLQIKDRPATGNHNRHIHATLVREPPV